MTNTEVLKGRRGDRSDTGCKNQANLSMRADETRWINQMTGDTELLSFLLSCVRQSLLFCCFDEMKVKILRLFRAFR